MPGTGAHLVRRARRATAGQRRTGNSSRCTTAPVRASANTAARGSTRCSTTPGATPDPVLKQIQKDKHLGAWNVYAALYGTADNMNEELATLAGSR